MVLSVTVWHDCCRLMSMFASRRPPAPHTNIIASGSTAPAAALSDLAHTAMMGDRNEVPTLQERQIPKLGGTERLSHCAEPHGKNDASRHGRPCCSANITPSPAAAGGTGVTGSEFLLHSVSAAQRRRRARHAAAAGGIGAGTGAVALKPPAGGGAPSALLRMLCPTACSGSVIGNVRCALRATALGLHSPAVNLHQDCSGHQLRLVAT